MRFRLEEAAVANIGSSNAHMSAGETASLSIAPEEPLPSPHGLELKTKEQVTPIRPSDFTSVRLLPMRNQESIRERRYARRNEHKVLAHPKDRIVQMSFLTSTDAERAVEVDVSVLLTERFSQSFISRKFAELMKLRVLPLLPSEARSYITPRGRIKPTSSAAITFKDKSLESGLSFMRILVHDNSHHFPAEAPLIFGRLYIEQVRSRSETANIPLQSTPPQLYRCCECNKTFGIDSDLMACTGAGLNGSICAHWKCSGCPEA
jgi:hypothetical protein